MRNHLRISLVFALALLADAASASAPRDRELQSGNNGRCASYAAASSISRAASVARSDADQKGRWRRPQRRFASSVQQPISGPGGGIDSPACPDIRLGRNSPWRLARSFLNRNHAATSRECGPARAIQQPVTLTARSTGARHICTPSRSQMIGGGGITANSPRKNLPAVTFDRQSAGSSLPALTSWRRAPWFACPS